MRCSISKGETPVKRNTVAVLPVVARLLARHVTLTPGLLSWRLNDDP
jgi:hypothetical protein